MAELAAHQSSSTTKLLLIGDNGSGKTGACASLAAAGYNLRFVDLDNGLDVLANILRDPKSPYGPEALARVKFETITDPMKRMPNGALVAKQATVYQRVSKLLNDWPGLGPVSSWGPSDVLVVDSLSMLATAAMDFVLSMNARLGQQPHQSDWYTAQGMLENFARTIFDEGIRCNVVVNCHVVYIEDENTKITRGYPATLGKALSPKIGTYFNSILQCKTVGFGASLKRKVLTTSTGLIELKNSSPLKVKPDYPLETGLADYFAAVREPGWDPRKVQPPKPEIPPAQPEPILV